MNEENEWDHKIPAEVKEGPADCIRMAEVRAVLKKMKRHKAPGLSGLVMLCNVQIYIARLQKFSGALTAENKNVFSFTEMVAEMIQATGDIGTQWILDLCNGIVLQCFDAVGWAAGRASGL